jgi:hypothetical protein
MTRLFLITVACQHTTPDKLTAADLIFLLENIAAYFSAEDFVNEDDLHKRKLKLYTHQKQCSYSNMLLSKSLITENSKYQHQSLCNCQLPYIFKTTNMLSQFQKSVTLMKVHTIMYTLNDL